MRGAPKALVLQVARGELSDHCINGPYYEVGEMQACSSRGGLADVYAVGRQARRPLSPDSRPTRQVDSARTPPMKTAKCSVPAAQRPGRHVCSGAAGALCVLAQVQVRGAQTAERRRC